MPITPQNGVHVFVDATGRRGRAVRLAGCVAGAVCLGYVLVLVGDLAAESLPADLPDAAVDQASSTGDQALPGPAAPRILPVPPPQRWAFPQPVARPAAPHVVPGAPVVPTSTAKPAPAAAPTHPAPTTKPHGGKRQGTLTEKPGAAETGDGSTKASE